MKMTRHHGIYGKATASHSATPGLYNITLDRADGAGHIPSKIYPHITDTKEGGGLRDEEGPLSKV
jgi:hypothetical protein